MPREKRTSRGYFEATITIGYDDSGKRIRKRLRAKTLQGLREKKEQALASKQQGTLTIGRRAKVSDYLADWLERVVKPTADRSTHTRYEQDVRNHLTPMLGRYRLDKLEVQHGQEMVAKLSKPDASGKRRAPRTIRNIVATLRTALEQAKVEGLVTRNIAADIRLPKMPPPELETITADGVRALLVAVRGERLEALFWVLALLGIREGEALALQWDDVDLERGIIRVTHSLRRLKQDDGPSKLTRKTTKKHKQLTFTVPPVLVRVLKRHKAHQDEEATVDGWQDHGYVFTSERGTPIDAQNFVSRTFKPALERTGLPRAVRVHDLRHATATLLISLGTDPKTVSAILGHSSAAFTMGTYVNALPSLSAPALEQLGQLLESDAQTIELPRKVT